MDNFVLTLNIVLPLFIVMLVGFFSRRMKWIDPHTTLQMNGLVYRVFLPLLLFRNIVEAGPDRVFRPGIFLFIGIAMLAMYLIVMFIVRKIERAPSKIGVMIQGACRSNYALFGIPLISSIYPNADVSLASLLVVIVVPLTNTMSVIALESNRGGKTNVYSIIKSVFKNPLIISSLLGFVVLLLGIRLPSPLSFLEKAVKDVSQITTPLALFLLGASIDITKVRGNIKPLLFSIAGKLVIVPLVMVTIAVLLGFRSVELACALVAFAAPTAVNSYTMALLMGGDGELAAECVVFSTAFSAVTIFAFVYALLQLNLL